MSHFAVLVIGENVDEQLAPFHEFECTGTDDQFVQTIDVTEESREEFESSTRSMIKLKDGSLVSRYHDQFYRDPTDEERTIIGPIAGTGCGHGISWASKDWGDGKGYRTKVRFVPEGTEKVEVPFESFTAWVTDYNGTSLVKYGDRPDLAGNHKYGYAMLNEAGEVIQLFKRTNPNKKWDWYTQGGRWGGFLKLKSGRNADGAPKAAIDFDGMRNVAGAKAAHNWDKVAEATGGRSWTSWEEMHAIHKDQYDVARDAYHAQETKKQAAKALDDGFFPDVDQYLVPREKYIQQKRDEATVLYAILKDGEWISRGDMGMFGITSNGKDKSEWATYFNKVLDDLPDGTMLTVVDCHI